MRKLWLAAFAAFLLVPGATANHDPFHAACLQKLALIDAAYHGSGTWKQRASAMHNRLHEASVCYQEPAVPPPPAPPPPPVPPPPPPPPVPQGENLPAFHSGTVGLTYYLDAVNGNDSAGDGSSGSPWKTVQKAHDYLKNTATWPTDQDVQVLMRSGTYQAASGSYTLDISFVSGARSPNANRWLIWKPDAGHEGAVIVESPTGTEAAKGAIRLQNTTGANFMVFRGLKLYGGNERRGSAGNGNSIGLYLVGNNNSDVEFIYGEIYGFQATAGSPSSAQALQVAGASAARFKYAFNKVHDIGTTTGTSDFQEHGAYIQGPDALVLNNLFYNIVNGYDCQFFSGSAGAGAIIAHNTFADAEASGVIIDDSAANVRIKNNIFAHHTGRGSSSYGIEFYPPGTPSSTSVVDFAVYFNNQGGNRSSSPSGWTFTNETQADPLFVNSGSDDWHLQAGSPAIGYSDTTYSPAVDLDGNARPAGDEDAGAFQFHSSVAGSSLKRPIDSDLHSY